MRSQVLSKYIEWMKKMSVIMIRIENTYKISLVFFTKKQSSHGVQLENTRIFNSIVDWDTDNLSLNYCQPYGITLANMKIRLFCISLSLRRSSFIRKCFKINERKLISLKVIHKCLFNLIACF